MNYERTLVRESSFTCLKSLTVQRISAWFNDRFASQVYYTRETHL